MRYGDVVRHATDPAAPTGKVTALVTRNGHELIAVKWDSGITEHVTRAELMLIIPAFKGKQHYRTALWREENKEA